MLDGDPIRKLHEALASEPDDHKAVMLGLLAVGLQFAPDTLRYHARDFIRVSAERNCWLTARGIAAMRLEWSERR